MTSELTAHARRALHRGLCVLPAATDGSKRPALNWKPYQHERPTAGQVEAWFGAPGTYDGLGYICGQVSGNLEMFEFEARAVNTGLYDQFLNDAHAAELGFVDAVDMGYCELSPAGGIHWLYRVDGQPVDGNLKLARQPGDQPNTVDVLIETRGEGGWTVAAPSAGRTHPTGRAWTLLHGGVDTITTINTEQRQELLRLARTYDRMPVTETVAPTQPYSEPAIPAHTGEHDGDQRPGDILNRTTTWHQILEPAGWTFLFERDGTGYWRRPGKQHGISATTNNLGTDRLKVFTSSTVFDTEGTYDKLGAVAKLHHQGDITAAARATADRLGLTPPPAPALNTIIGDTLQNAPETGSYADDDDFLKPIDWPTFWKQDHSDREWLIEPFLVRGRNHALYAPAKTGKSLLVLEAVVALATGRPYMHQAETEPLNVGYLDYEMTEGDLYQRLEAMEYGPETDLSRLHYFLVAGLPGLDTPAGAQAVLRLAERYKLDVVIIDTTARAVEGEENESKTIIDLYRHTGLALKRRGITVLRVDHAGKNLEKGQRGTSAKNDDVDVVWQLTGAESRFVLKCTHQRVGYVPQQIELQRTDDPLGYRITTYQWPAGTAELAAKLEQIGTPVDEGRDKVRARVKAWNDAHPDDPIQTKTAVLTAAIKWRKVTVDDTPTLDELTGDRSGDRQNGQAAA